MINCDQPIRSGSWINFLIRINNVQNQPIKIHRFVKSTNQNLPSYKINQSNTSIKMSLNSRSNLSSSNRNSATIVNINNNGNNNLPISVNESRKSNSSQLVMQRSKTQHLSSYAFATEIKSDKLNLPTY